MTTAGKLHVFVRIALFLCVTAVGLSSPAQAANSGAKKIVLYTAMTATTPQMPLFGAIKSGWPAGHSLKVDDWKTLDDLRGIVLAGKGHIWVGHLEGFAQAAMRGAPVTLICVTGWKKFYFLAPENVKATSLEELAAAMRASGQPLAVAPQDSPALAILGAIEKRGGPSFTVAAMAPQQLMLEIMRGTRQFALLPEPLLSSLMAKKKTLRIAASLEEEYARLFGGPAHQPFVGIAVHTAFAKENPELVKSLIGMMQKQAATLTADPAAAATTLPETVIKAVGHDIIAASLKRDMIRVVPANTMRSEIEAFLKMVLTPGNNTDMPARINALLSGTFLLPGGK